MCNSNLFLLLHRQHNPSQDEPLCQNEGKEHRQGRQNEPRKHRRVIVLGELLELVEPHGYRPHAFIRTDDQCKHERTIGRGERTEGGDGKDRLGQ